MGLRIAHATATSTGGLTLLEIEDISERPKRSTSHRATPQSMSVSVLQPSQCPTQIVAPALHVRYSMRYRDRPCRESRARCLLAGQT